MKNDGAEFDPRRAQKGGQQQPQRQDRPAKPGQPQWPSKPGQQPSPKPGQPQWGQPGSGQN